MKIEKWILINKHKINIIKLYMILFIHVLIIKSNQLLL